MSDAADDLFNLDHFVVAQFHTYDDGLAELRRSWRTGHWMWFIFPQLVGLGNSVTGERYGIRSPAEARAYLDHPLLGTRLRTCIGVLQNLVGFTAEEMFGPVGVLKLRSSLTLFAEAAPDERLFRAALDRWCGGPDERTLAMLQAL